LNLNQAIKALLYVTGFAATLPAFAAVPTYNLIWLGFGNTANPPTASTRSIATDINNKGWITGYISEGLTWSHSAVWTPAGVINTELSNAQYEPCIGVSPGLCPDINNPSAINDSGLVVGWARTPDTNFGATQHSFYYDTNTANSLMLQAPAPLATTPGYIDSAADINSSGLIAGYLMDPYAALPQIAYLYTPGQAQMTSLVQPVLADGNPADMVFPLSINDSGVVVGYGNNFAVAESAVVWQGNTSKPIPGFSLAANSGWSFAEGINNAGLVTGVSTADAVSPRIARLHDLNTGTTVTLGDGEGVHVNNNGWVTINGATNGTHSSIFIPDAPNSLNGQNCLLDANVVPALVNTPDNIDNVFSINDAGVIVGAGSHNGLTEAYALVPTNAAASTPGCTAVISGVTIATSSLPNATAGLMYSTPVTITLGVAPYNVTVNGLPVGLGFDGVNVTGIPTTLGASNVTITAVDAQGISISKLLKLTVVDQSIGFAPSLPGGTVNTAYTANLSATGYGPFNFTATGLPAGLALNGNQIVGSPTTAGTYPVTLTATNLLGTSKQVKSSIVISSSAVTGQTCTKPAGSKSFTVHAAITATGAGNITIGTKVVTIPDCAKVVYKGTATTFGIGFDAEVKSGYTINGINYSTSLIVDDGK